MDEVPIPARVNNQVIFVAELIECQIVASTSENERRLLWRRGIFPICFPVRLIESCTLHRRSYPSSTIQPPELPYRCVLDSNQQEPNQLSQSDPAGFQPIGDLHFCSPFRLPRHRHRTSRHNQHCQSRCKSQWSCSLSRCFQACISSPVRS